MLSGFLERAVILDTDLGPDGATEGTKDVILVPRTSVSPDIATPYRPTLPSPPLSPPSFASHDDEMPEDVVGLCRDLSFDMMTTGMD